jgi:hypothetical protein
VITSYCRDGIPAHVHSIDDNGDTTLTDLALESVENGELTFEKVVRGAAP